ncbi:MAG: Uma2 family endonuclease [Saprospirales bacterium]|nr:Uma2 family endonuclease [Saprospirales bacterium]
MALDVMKKLWTVDEVLQMVDTGILPHDNHLELIRGELIEMSPMGFKHGVAVGTALPNCSSNYAMNNILYGCNRPFL